MQPQKAKVFPTPVNFTITPDTLQNSREVRRSQSDQRLNIQTYIHFIEANVSPGLQRSSPPKFLIKGHLDATNCVISQPLTGELVVENSDLPIKSIDLQLVRVETCGKHQCGVDDR